MTASGDRRRFSRIPFEASVTLTTDNHQWTTELLDISLKGIMVSRPHDWPETPVDGLVATIHAPADAFTITMNLANGHAEPHRIGFECREIDIDSATQLRRLVELNIGETSLLNRELGELFNATG